jgi:hypothetical protein
MAANTPGYNIRLCIRIRANAQGRRVAHYFSRAALRWLPVKIADADRWIAAGEADAYEGA